MDVFCVRKICIGISGYCSVIFASPLSRWEFWKSLGQPLRPPHPQPVVRALRDMSEDSLQKARVTYLFFSHYNFHVIFERLSPWWIGYVYPLKSGASPGISEKAIALKNVWWWNSNLRPNNTNSLPHPFGLTIPGYSLLCDIDIVGAKYLQKSSFCSASPDPLSPTKILKIPRATNWALWIFKIPSGLRGIWVKIPTKKPKFPIKFPSKPPKFNHKFTKKR